MDRLSAERIAAATAGVTLEEAQAVIAKLVRELSLCVWCGDTGRFTFAREVVLDLYFKDGRGKVEAYVPPGTTGQCPNCLTGTGDPRFVKWFCQVGWAVDACQKARAKHENTWHDDCGHRVMLPMPVREMPETADARDGRGTARCQRGPASGSHRSGVSGEEGPVPACPFCVRIADGEFDGERDAVFDFEPLNPVTPGHRLFVPFEHVAAAASMPGVTGRVFRVASQWAANAQPAFNLITSAGRAATQSVPHLHVHYVPRHEGDGLTLPWTGQQRT